MSTHNLYFGEDLRKLFMWITLLSGAMVSNLCFLKRNSNRSKTFCFRKSCFFCQNLFTKDGCFTA